MPSGHATLSTTVFMGMAFLFASSIRRKLRWPIYTVGIALSLMVGISRLYLGAHWFTDVLAAWLLSAAVLTLVIISYEHRKEARINPYGIMLVTILTFMVTFSYYHHKHFAQLKTDYAKIDAAPMQIAMKDWWEKNAALPAYHVSLFGFPSQTINIVWAGNLEKIEATLLQEDWIDAPARDWVSTLHRIADVESTQYLSMVSPQYLDKRPELILVRRADGLKGLLVLRLWNADRFIAGTKTTLWIGTVGVIPRSYSWLSKSRSQEIEIDPDFVFPYKKAAAAWEWKMIRMDMNKTVHQSRMIDQKIMLIRSKSS
jgi:undecaprenyl-diphosphatase